MKLKLLLITSFIILLSACGAEDEQSETADLSAPEGSNEEVASTILEGSWIGSCEDYSEAGDGSRYGQTTFEYIGKDVTITNRTYDSTSCEGNEYASILTSIATVIIGDDVIIASGDTVKQISTEVSSQTLVYSLAVDITAKNNDAYCGYTDWTSGVVKDVFSCRIGENTTILDIVLIDGTSLYFGEAEESGYPITLESLAYTKQ